MTWAAILGLAAGAFAFKAIGLFGLSRIHLAGAGLRLVQLIPAALLAGLITLGVFEEGDATAVATRCAGVVAGSVVAWRRAPLFVVLVVAAGVTAALRALL